MKRIIAILIVTSLISCKNKNSKFETVSKIERIVGGSSHTGFMNSGVYSCDACMVYINDTKAYDIFCWQQDLWKIGDTVEYFYEGKAVKYKK